MNIVNLIGDQTRPTLAPGVRLHTDKATGEPVLLFPEGLLQLNAAAHAILTRCNGQLTITAIISSLSSEYATSDAALRGDVLDCLNQLHTRKLIVFSK